MFAFLLAQTLQTFEPFPPTPFDRVIPIVIDAQDAVLAGHGHAERVTYKAEFSGTLHLWTKSVGELDLFLRVETPSGALVQEDDNSGGGKTPYVKLEVELGREFVIVTAVVQGQRLGSLELCAIAAPETVETRAASKAANQAIAEVRRLRVAGERSAGRKSAQAVLDACTAVSTGRSSELVASSMWALGFETYGLSDLRAADVALGHALRHRLRTLPEEHPDLQAKRQAMAVTIQSLGDLQGARALEERVLEVRSRTLPEDHAELQVARQNLAVTIRALGDLQGARALFERVLEVCSRTLPEEHPDLQDARQNLAATIGELGDFEGARALEQRVLEVRLRTLPEEHPDVQTSRLNLAVTLDKLGDLQGARALFERVLEVFSRTLPEDHPDLQKARLNLAATMHALGDLRGARSLSERVLDVCSRTLPEDHPDLQKARLNLATTIGALGDLQGARALQERILEVRSRTLPDEHPDLQSARLNLAATIGELGDLQGERALDERVLEVFARTLPEEHSDLQKARLNLAATTYLLGDPRGARSLFERVLEVYSRTLPEQHPDLQKVRLGLAATIKALGDLQSARVLEERVLAVFSSTLPEEHPDLQAARQNLAATTLIQASRSAKGPANGGERRREIEEGRDRGATLLRDRSHVQTCVAREVRLNAPGREAESRCASLTAYFGFTLSAALGFGGLDPCSALQPAAFLYSESTRNAGVSSSALARRAAQSEGYREARAQLRSATDELARLVQAGTSSDGYRTALSAREAAEKGLLELGRKASGGKATSLELDLETLSAALEPGTVAVAYRSYTRSDLKWPEAPSVDGFTVPEHTNVANVCAFIVRARDFAKTPDALASLTLLDLGPIEPITAAITNWREALGAGDGRGVGVTSRAADPALAAYGAEVRRLVFDPLRTALGDAQHVVVVLDGPLQLVPLDALPAGDDDTKRLGDTLRIETRMTLGELLDAPLALEGERVLVGLGGAEFDGERTEAKEGSDSAAEASAMIAAAVPAKSASLPSILRGGAFGTGFSALPGTLRELEGLEREFTKSAGADAKLKLLRGKDATKAALLAAAPRARWLHIATHGWFAPESIRSWEDSDPIDAKSALVLRRSGEETVKGMSPMLLCGLALAGANLPEDAVGRAPGLLTADELSTLDLSNCELAVLSACDTARGEMRRAGQGVASLQKALQIAGARSVITSLWKVPDEATKDLMLDFYRCLWVDKKPKWQALWEAKLKLRNAKDERGAPKYTTRDWAAWVLTGEPE